MSIKQKGRLADREKVLLALNQADGLSNAALRAELELSDTRYNEIIKQLLKDGFVEKYRCYGGGIRITGLGEKNTIKFTDSIPSTVKNEKALYPPLVEYLNLQSQEM